MTVASLKSIAQRRGVRQFVKFGIVGASGFLVNLIKSTSLAAIIGFALIWHIWWLMIVGLVGAYATFVVFAWRDVPEYIIPADEVAQLDRARRAIRQDVLAGAAPWL